MTITADELLEVYRRGYRDCQEGRFEMDKPKQAGPQEYNWRFVNGDVVKDNFGNEYRIIEQIVLMGPDGFAKSQKEQPAYHVVNNASAERGTKYDYELALKVHVFTEQ